MRGLMSTALRALRDAAARRAAAAAPLAPPAAAAALVGGRAAAAAALLPGRGAAGCCSISGLSSLTRRSWGASRRFTARAAAPASSPAAPAPSPAADAVDDAANEPTCWRCTVEDVSGETADELTDVLLSFGAQSASVEEHRPAGAAEQPIFDLDAPLWERCTVVAHFALEADVEGAFAAARSILGLPDLAYARAGVANQARRFAACVGRRCDRRPPLRSPPLRPPAAVCRARKHAAKRLSAPPV